MAKVEDDSLDARIRDITHRIKSRDDSAAASRSSSIAVAIGSETTQTLLRDIRNSMNQQLTATNNLANAIKDRESREEQRHKDICTLLLGATMNSGTSESASVNTPLNDGLSPRSSPQVNTSLFYYDKTLVRSSSILLSAMLMHLDSTLSADPRLAAQSAGERQYMSIKDWSNICNAVLVKGIRRRHGLRTAKPSDDDFKRVCSIIATNVQSRPPHLDPSQFVALSSSCSPLLRTLDWLRTTLLECKGLLSPRREARLRNTEYPFVADGSMIVAGDSNYVPTDEGLHMKVQLMNFNAKKHYIGCILEQMSDPEDAYAETIAVFPPKE